MQKPLEIKVTLTTEEARAICDLADRRARIDYMSQGELVIRDPIHCRAFSKLAKALRTSAAHK